MELIILGAWVIWMTMNSFIFQNKVPNLLSLRINIQRGIGLN